MSRTSITSCRRKRFRQGLAVADFFSGFAIGCLQPVFRATAWLLVQLLSIAWTFIATFAQRIVIFRKTSTTFVSNDTARRLKTFDLRVTFDPNGEPLLQVAALGLKARLAHPEIELTAQQRLDELAAHLTAGGSPRLWSCDACGQWAIGLPTWTCCRKKLSVSCATQKPV